MVSLISLIECVPRYPGSRSPDLPTTTTPTITDFLLHSCIEFEFHRHCLFRSISTGEIVKLHIVIGTKSNTKKHNIHKVYTVKSKSSAIAVGQVSKLQLMTMKCIRY